MGAATLLAAAAVAAAWVAAREPAFAPLLWLGLLLSCLALRPGERRFVSPVWLTAALAAFAVTWPTALDHEAAVRHALTFAAAALLFGLARARPPSDRALLVVALGIAATALVAGWQLAGGLDQAGAQVGQLPLAVQEAAAARLAGDRAFGTATLPGHFAALLLLAAPLGAAAIVRERGVARLGGVLTTALAVVGVVLTRSLAGAAVAAALLVLAAVWVLPRRWGVAAVVTAVVVVASLALARPDLTALSPVRLRWLNWRTTAWVAAQHPWLGVGLGGVGQASLTSPWAVDNSTPYSHNTLLQMLAEGGVASVGVLAALVVALVSPLRRTLATSPTLTLAVCVVPLHNLVDFSAYAPEVLWPWAVLAGTLAGRSLPPPRPLPGWLLVPVLAGGVVLSTLLWRAGVELRAAQASSPPVAVEHAMRAARLAPWTVTPALEAAGVALDGPVPRASLIALDGLLGERGWVWPVSSGWAEARGRVLLALGRPGEALVWIGEARRRAPSRDDLLAWEARCAAP